ncbi:MAG: efflux RND transporter periplasmic adaptor subunit [Imperialibacter sp.]|uniref:efflux RND transporter periplasmic adaptor subunit n=1 Tax=Imperialibacter sp. TaxID=2038411 RepID=UPI0032EDD6B6
MNYRKISFIGVCAVVAVFIGWKLFANKKVVDARELETTEVSFAIPVKTQSVRREDISSEQMLTGVFEANESISLVAESQGTVTKIAISEGDRVGKGTMVLKIGDASLQAQLTSSKGAYEKAAKDLERFKRLEATGAVSKQQIEEVALAVKNAEANIESINQQLRFTNLKSPISGLVNDVFVEEGEFVMPGTKVAEIISVDLLNFIINVSESDLNIVKEGREVEIMTDAYPLKSYKGKIEHISYKADDSRKYKVTILVVNDKTNPLRSGMFGKASFRSLAGGQDALVIPRRAIVGSLKDAKVYLVSGNKVVLRSIVVGAKLNDNLEVLKGLLENEVVVVSGQINLTDQAEIRVAN